MTMLPKRRRATDKYLTDAASGLAGMAKQIIDLTARAEAASPGVTREEWDALIAAEMVKYGQHAHHENLLVDIRNAIVARLSSASPAPAAQNVSDQIIWCCTDNILDSYETKVSGKKFTAQRTHTNTVQVWWKNKIIGVASNPATWEADAATIVRNFLEQKQGENT